MKRGCRWRNFHNLACQMEIAKIAKTLTRVFDFECTAYNLDLYRRRGIHMLWKAFQSYGRNFFFWVCDSPKTSIDFDEFINTMKLNVSIGACARFTAFANGKKIGNSCYFSLDAINNQMDLLASMNLFKGKTTATPNVYLRSITLQQCAIKRSQLVEKYDIK